MRDKLLTYALVASIGVHLIILGLVGKTSAAKPIEVEQLKIVRVDLVKTPDDVSIRQDKAQSPKPVEESPPEAPYVPPPQKMVTDKNPPKPKPVSPKPISNPLKSLSTQPVGRASASPAGDPGGALSGITTPNGEDLGQASNGNTPSGWVPGPDNGLGLGSGSGQGVGNPVPDADVRPGNSLTPGSGIEPPPSPKMVSVTICSISGMLPGKYCDKTDRLSFKDGSEPSRKCDICKAPEPKHVSTLADRVEPEIAKDSKPTIPDIDEPGDYVIKIRYTVNKDGSVSDIEITQSSGIKAIDKAIIAAASKIRYNPAIQNGEPRSVTVKRTYKVRI